MIKLFNTRTHAVEDFHPLNGNNVGIYSCGPTVYNHAHIGNLSTYIYSDIIRRTLKSNGYSVHHVMNFTDVDDKTINRALTEYPELDRMEALNKLTKYYEQIFLDEMKLVGNNVDDINFVKATDNITAIQKLISTLLDQNIAYIAQDGIYFSIDEYRKTRNYGQLSNLSFTQNGTARERINNDSYSKDNPSDFALWKAAKANEPSWEYILPDGQSMPGRPGWHIECSAMSTTNLGQPFDIHTGGVDLIFPHHENEIAQSTAGNQPELYANFFVHNEHLLVDGQKMSKSEGNFYTLPDIYKKGFSGLDLRMLILQSHYQSASNFTWHNLESAANRWQNWLSIAELRHQVVDTPNSEQFEQVGQIIEDIHDAIDSNIDTPTALMLVDKGLSLFSPENVDLSALNQLLECIEQLLGLPIITQTPDISDTQYDLIEQRNQLREQKNWDESDKIRDLLANDGIYIKDGAIALWTRQQKGQK